MTTALEKEHPSLYVPRVGRLVRVEQVTELERFFTIALEGDGGLGHEPGQFVEVSLLGVGEAPVSVCSSPTRGETFDLTVRRVGSVTGAMDRLEAGDRLGIRGPYGKGFPMDSFREKDLLVVAGGIGLVPLRSVIQYVLDNRKDYGTLTILYGTKGPSEILYGDEMGEWAASADTRVLVTVDKPDEGWHGKVGVVTRLFKEVHVTPETTMALVVGPPVMFKFVVLELSILGIQHSHIYASLERHMKCGLGRCGHCQINGLFVCREGPVFTYRQLKTLTEAF